MFRSITSSPAASQIAERSRGVPHRTRSVQRGQGVLSVPLRGTGYPPQVWFLSCFFLFFRARARGSGYSPILARVSSVFPDFSILPFLRLALPFLRLVCLFYGCIHFLP